MKNPVPCQSKLSLLVLAGALSLSLCMACSNGARGGDSDPDSNADGGIQPDLAFNGRYMDFPAQPVLDTGGALPVPRDSGSLFGPPGNGAPTGGPCLTDPEIGALFPRNWLRLRFRFTAPAGQNLYELRLHAQNQVNDLVVYTTSTQWTMPADLWANLTAHSADQALTVSIRGAQLSGSTLVSPPALGTTGDITIAPVPANGTIVYWTTTGGTVLRGFKIGEETVHDVIKPAQVGGGVQCVGCHSSTPDGNFVAFSQAMSADGGQSTVGLRSVDGKASLPAYLTPSALALLGRLPQQQPVFSGAHYGPGDRMGLVMSAANGPYELDWIDLEATAQTQGTGWGVIARTGDARQAASAAWSHSGRTIAYVSTASSGAGTIVTDGDLYTVPYNNRQGGAAMPIPGASDPTLNEFYPAFSPDDELLAFNRVAAGQSSYNNGRSEVFVIPTQGGSANRLVGNDPPACGGKVSPGVTNSWPKWSPETKQYNGKQYYWIAFSSTRAGSNPQLFVTGVVVQAGTIKTYNAVYLWNQPVGDANHTAAWDVFNIIIG